MRKATITALKESIATWECRAAGEDIWPDADSCALCDRFQGNGHESCQLSGEECPVREATGAAVCSEATAFLKYDEYYRNSVRRGNTAQYAASIMGRRRAQKEVDFLKSLLP